MFYTILKKELLIHLLGFRYYAVLFGFVALACGATVTRTHLFAKLRDDNTQTQHANVQARSTVSTLQPYDAIVMGYLVEKPPNVLSIYCAGLENEMTRTRRAAMWFYDRIYPRKQQSLFARINYPFDIVTIITIMGSLLALLLVFDSISGERERGTLKLLLCGPVSRATIILAKMVAGFLVLAMPMLLCWALSLLYPMVAGHGVTFTNSELIRLGLIAALSLAYVLVFFAVGMVASALGRTASFSLALCMVIWLVLVLAVPPLLPTVGRMVTHQVPRTEIARAIWRITDTLEAQNGPRWIAEGDASSPDRLGRDASVEWGLQASLAPVMAQANVEYQRHFRKRRQTVYALSGLSPAATFTCVASDVAGTGPESYGRFQEYWQDFRKVFADNHWAWIGTRNQTLLPSFSPPIPGMREVMMLDFVGLVSLACFGVLFYLLSFMLFVLRRDA